MKKIEVELSAEVEQKLGQLMEATGKTSDEMIRIAIAELAKNTTI